MISKLRKIKGIFFGITLLAPSAAMAQPPENFAALVGVLVGILNAVIPIIFGVALLAVLWAGAQMILNSDNPQKRADGRRTILWGVIVLVIMISMWGLVNLIADTFF